ncbi:hypothetical protein VPHD479_0020 [Vibrio phage D479]
MSKSNVVQIRDTATQIRDKLQGLAGTNRLDATAVEFIDSFQTIWVSTNGSDTNDGRTPTEPFLTIGAALTAAATLPATSKRVVKCVDASTFAENVSVSSSVDLDLEHCSLVGNITSSLPVRTKIKLAVLQGSLTTSNGVHAEIQQVAGNLIVGNSNSAAAYISVEDWVSGTIDTTNAVGDLFVDIKHNDANLVIPTDVVGFNPFGFVAGSVVQPTSLVDSLETLTGDDRLDASAIKGITSGSNPHTRVDFTDFGAAGNGWYDLISWPAIPAFTTDTWGADFIIYMNSNTTDTIITQRVNINFPVGIANSSDDTMIRIIGRIVAGSSVGGGQYRIIQDTSTVTSMTRLQVQFTSGNTYAGSMTNALPLDYSGSGATFGGLALHTPTGNEVVIKEINTANWDDQSIHDGSTGGIACESIGNHQTSNAYIDFTTSDIATVVNDQTVIRASEVGTRFSAGEYEVFEKQFRGSTPTAWPWDTTPSTDSTLTLGNTDNPNFTFPIVTCEQTETAMVTTPIIGYVPPFISNTSALRPTGANGRCNFSITGFVPNQRVGIRVYITKDGSSQGGVWRMDRGGVQQSDINLSGTAGQTLTTFLEYTTVVTEADFTAGAIDLQVYRTDNPPGGTPWNDAGWMSFVVSYDLIVESIEPALDTNVVAQFDSNTRGILPPRIAPFLNPNHPDGAQAVDVFSGRPIVSFDGDWSYYLSSRRKASDLEYGMFAYADAGTTWGEQGWTGNMVDTSQIVDDYLGFPKLIRSTSTTSVRDANAPLNTDALWQAAWDNGYRLDFRIMLNGDGDIMQVNAEPRNTATSWPTGRYTLTAISETGVVNIYDTTDTVIASTTQDEMHTFSIVVQNPTASTIAQYYLDDVLIGEIDIQGFDGQRGLYLWENAGASRGWSIEYIAMYVLETGANDVTLNRTDVEAAVTYSNAVENATVRIPKGLFDFDATVDVINGSSTPMTITGEVGSNISFHSGDQEITIPAGSGARIAQTARPRGNKWAIVGSERNKTPTSQGHSLQFLFDPASNTILNRHGSFTGAITITDNGVGDIWFDFEGYSSIGSFGSDNVTALATTNRGFGTNFIDVELDSAAANLVVNTQNIGGNPIDTIFSVALYW